MCVLSINTLYITEEDQSEGDTRAHTHTHLTWLKCGHKFLQSTFTLLFWPPRFSSSSYKRTHAHFNIVKLNTDSRPGTTAWCVFTCYFQVVHPGAAVVTADISFIHRSSSLGRRNGMVTANEDRRGILCLCSRMFCMICANKCRSKSIGLLESKQQR